MRQFLRYIVSKTWKPYLERRISEPCEFQYENINLTVVPGVFHPGYFYSTKFLLHHILKMDLQMKNVLELGCGSGLISIATAKQGANVTSSDISISAIHSLKENSIKNKVQLNIIHSDFFKNIPVQKFDLIFVNPPYYKGKPLSEKDHAWYCGSDHEYFTNLFMEVKNYMSSNSLLILVLSDGCEIEKIKTICEKSGLQIKLTETKKHLLETELVYHISF